MQRYFKKKSKRSKVKVMNARLNIYLIAFLTIFHVLMFEHNNKVEAAMVRLVLNRDCSDADMVQLRSILDNLSPYIVPIGYPYRRQLRHGENYSNKTEITKTENMETIQKKLFDNKNVKYINNISMVEEETDVAPGSSRELWPNVCADLCAGYIPRRCMITRCIGYRRRQRELIFDHIRVAHDPCLLTVTIGDYSIDSAIAERKLTSGCAVTRTWQCVLYC